MTVSVIIATRNRAATVVRTVEQLRPEAQRFGARVIVVDNGSTDETPQLLQRLASSFPLLTVISEPRAGKNRALNRALEAAEADLLLFTDDDVVFAADWMEQFIRAADRWPGHAVFAGPIVPHLPGELPPHLKGHEFLTAAFAAFEHGSIERPIPGVMPYGPNFALRRSVTLGEWFDERIGPEVGDARGVPLGDETEFLRRLVARSDSPVYIPGAWVRHHVEVHQFADSWMYDRSFRMGRCVALLDPDRSSARLRGVPRYLWRQLVEAQAVYWRESLLRRKSSQFNAGLRLHNVRGQIYQYRRGARDERRRSDAVSDIEAPRPS